MAIRINNREIIRKLRERGLTRTTFTPQDMADAIGDQRPEFDKMDIDDQQDFVVSATESVMKVHPNQWMPSVCKAEMPV